MSAGRARALLGTALAGLLVAGAYLLPKSSVAPPRSVETLVANLKTTRLLERVGEQPPSCRTIGSGRPWRAACDYRSGDIQVGISWYRSTRRLRDITIQKTTSRDAAPFAWADLATTVRLLCPEIDTGQGEALANAIPAKLRGAEWVTSRDPTHAARDRLMRLIILNHSASCVFEAAQYDEAEGTRETLRAEWFRTD